MVSAGKSRKPLLLLITAALVCAAVVAVIVVLRRDGSGPVNGGDQPPKAESRYRELLKRLPGSTGLLLATDDLKRLAADLEDGPAGKLLREESVARFISALRQEPPGATASFMQGVRIMLSAARPSAREAAIVVWDLESQRGPGMALIVRTGREEAPRTARRLEVQLAPPGGNIRKLQGGSGATIRTLAPEGREGTALGYCGEWVVLSRNIVGCRELLQLAAGTVRKPPERIESALKSVGDARLVGFMNAGKIIRPELARQLGLEKADWLAYAASPDKAGRWSERLLLSGKPSKVGLLAGLGNGGKRPMLKSLPASALLAISANVSDGVEFWRGIEATSQMLGYGSTVTYLRGMIELSTGAEFEKDVASRLEGEITFAGLRARGATYPQGLLGLGVSKGSSKPLAETVAKALAIGGGEIKSGEYRGVAFRWLVNKRLAGGLLPSPCYCTKGDRIVASTSSVHLKELIAGRGGTWLPPKEVEHLSRGMLSARISLARAMPYIIGEVRGSELLAGLGAKALENLPMQEELADHLDRLDLVLAKGPQGLSAELRSPLPVGAVTICWMLAGE